MRSIASMGPECIHKAEGSLPVTLIRLLHVCQHARQINATWNVSLSSYSHNLLFYSLVEGQACSLAAKESVLK